MVIVAFDVDGTLFDYTEQPREAIVALARACIAAPDIDVVIWSGGGLDYAHQRAADLGFPEEGYSVIDKFRSGVLVDLAIDDDAIAMKADLFLMVKE